MSGQTSATGGITYTTSWGQSTSSQEEVFDTLIVDRSVGGIARIRSVVPLANIKKVFKINHNVLTLAEKNAIHTFYTTYRDSDIDLLWKPDTLHYAVRFSDVFGYKIPL